MINPSQLRQNIYKLLDQVIESGKPLEVKRKGVILKIIPPERKNKLEKLEKRKGLNCKPEDLLNIDWSNEWKETHT